MSELKQKGRPRKYEVGLAKDWTNQTEYNSNYYQNNKENMKQNYIDNKKIITCECGSMMSDKNFEKHCKTKLHKRRLEKIKKKT
jgi:hypothetical protein